MPYNSIYPPLMPNHYQAIEGFEKPTGGSKPRSSLDNPRRGLSADDNMEEKEDHNMLAKQREADYRTMLEKRKEERKEIERNKSFYERYAVEIQCTFCVVTLIILAFIALYVFSILLGTIIIISNYLFETSMVALFGRATYNKNFPICSNEIYQGSDCYTRTSTYCT